MMWFCFFAAGKVSLAECKKLSVGLRSLAGGSTFLPNACSAMIKRDEEHEKVAAAGSKRQ